jgi:hypothetical protein
MDIVFVKVMVAELFCGTPIDAIEVPTKST